jgi:hypothetical protein
MASAADRHGGLAQLPIVHSGEACKLGEVRRRAVPFAALFRELPGERPAVRLIDLDAARGLAIRRAAIRRAPTLARYLA